MSLKFASRVKESSASTGTGSFTLGGAYTGYVTFASVFSDTDQVYYTIDSGGSDWEVGVGTIASSGSTLQRTTVLESSNANAAVNFSAGTKTVFCTPPARTFRGGWELIASATASASSSISFTGFDSNKYERYRVDFWNVTPDSDNFLRMRTSTNGGSSYDSAASDYLQLVGNVDAGGYILESVQTDSSIYLNYSSTMPATTNYPAFGSLNIYSPQSAQRCMIDWDITFYFIGRTRQIRLINSAWRDTAADVDAIQFFSGGTINTGEFRFFGRRK